MTETRPKILFLPKWYPHRQDPMPGLFVKNQAEAVYRFCDVAVLYVHGDRDCPNSYEVDFTEENNVIVVRVYYKIPSLKIPLAGSFLKLFRFLKAYRLGFHLLTNFEPDILHVHVLTRTGLIALIYRIFKRTPYIVSEHWSRYFPENNTYKGFLRKLLTRIIVRHSSALIPVSEKLKQAMIANGLNNRQVFIIPNSVDMDRFVIPGNRNPRDKKKIIHVSCFEDKSKNITGFLHAVKFVLEKRSDFEVSIIGEGPDFEYCRNAARDMGFNEDVVKFPGLKNDAEMAKIMGDTDFMVLSSNYETFGTVVIESLACGTPVVATAVGVVPEIINEANGIITSPGDMQALGEAIMVMLDKCSTYDRKQIRETVRNKFSKEMVGLQLYEIYSKILEPVRKHQ